MNFLFVIKSLAYSIAQITQGLLLHPYQTAQSLVRERVFAWMLWLPTLTVGSIYFFWKLILVPMVRLVFSCQESGFGMCGLLPLFSDWLLFFCLYWQILLLYLWIRFAVAANQKKHVT